MESEGPTNGGMLYHKVQESKLCAVHCMNTVLQDFFFSEFDLDALASDLDLKRRQMMLEGSGGGGDASSDFIAIDSVESHNVAIGGDFSIQVLHKALEVWDLQVIPLDNPVAESSEPYRINKSCDSTQSNPLRTRILESNFNPYQRFHPIAARLLVSVPASSKIGVTSVPVGAEPEVSPSPASAETDNPWNNTFALLVVVQYLFACWIFLMKKLDDFVADPVFKRGEGLLGDGLDLKGDVSCSLFMFFLKSVEHVKPH